MPRMPMISICSRRILRKVLVLLLLLAAFLVGLEPNTVSAAGVSAPAHVIGDSSQPGSVPQFYQTDEPWDAARLGSCAPSVGSSGCAVTSLAMVFKYFGVETDPGALNTWLREHHGYASGCLIYWPSAADIDPSRVTWVGTAGEDWNRLKSELDSGNPVVLEVHVGGSSHFIVATGHSADTFYIHDTTADGGTSLDFYGNTFVSMRIFHRRPASPANAGVAVQDIAANALTTDLP
jgi:hypothetical protein